MADGPMAHAGYSDNIRPDKVYEVDRTESIATALDAVSYEIERGQELLERLHHKISPVLNNRHEAMKDAGGPTPEDLSSDLQREIKNRAQRMRDFNDSLSAIIGRIDL